MNGLSFRVANNSAAYIPTQNVSDQTQGLTVVKVKKSEGDRACLQEVETPELQTRDALRRVSATLARFGGMVL